MIDIRPGLDESLSGSDSSSSEDENEDGGKSKESTLTALLKRQAAISVSNREVDEYSPKKRKPGTGKAPLIWFRSSLLPPDSSLGIYRAIFTDGELSKESEMVDVLRRKQLAPIVPVKQAVTSDISEGVPLPPSMTHDLSSPHIFLCMIGGGHFAAMVVALAPKVISTRSSSTGADQREATVLAHKTFHRYTTRRKQGGAQSANDASKGAAHSAGSSLRRYNEGALSSEVRSLLAQWRDLISTSQLLFIRASGTTNRRTLYGPYDDAVLSSNDARTRSFPFSTRRATQAELMRAFIQLTRVQISQVDDDNKSPSSDPALLPHSSPKPATTKPSPPLLTKAEANALLHTRELTSLLRRSRAPAILQYYTTHSLSPDFAFHPPSAHHHTPTPLHLASSLSRPPVILALLLKLAIDPTLPNADGRPAFDLAGDRASRDAFRIARHELGESRWNWTAAHIPEPLSRDEAEKRAERERMQEETKEKQRRTAEEERLKREIRVPDGVVPGGKGRGRKAIGSAVEKTGHEKREEEARGLGPEARMRLERERRARAAEERMRALNP